MSAMKVSILSAENPIFDGEADVVSASSEMGDIGVYPNHAPLLARLKPGQVCLRSQGQEDRLFFVSGGIIEVKPDAVTVLADTVLRGDDLDEAKAAEAKKRAEESLQSKLSDQEAAAALARIAEAAAQLRMIEEIRKMKR